MTESVTVTSFEWQKVESKASKTKGKKKPTVTGQGNKTGSGAQNGANEEQNAMMMEAKDYFKAYKDQIGAMDSDDIATRLANSVNKGASAGDQSKTQLGKKAAPAKPKTASNHVSEKPVVVESFNIDLKSLNNAKICEEIDGMKHVDMGKRCLNLAMNLNVMKSQSVGHNWANASISIAHPVKLLPQNIAKTLEKFVTNLPESCVAQNFELCLAELLSKSRSNATVWGYQTFIQLLARYFPEAAVLKNQKNLSSLFANSVSQGGIERSHAIAWSVLQTVHGDPKMAFKVWSQLLLPSISKRALSGVVTNYFSQLLSDESFSSGSEMIDFHDYFHILDYSFPRKSLLNELDNKSLKVLRASYPRVKQLSLTSGLPNNVANFFSSYLTRFKADQSEEMLLELSDCVLTCLRANGDLCFKLWYQMLERFASPQQPNGGHTSSASGTPVSTQYAENTLRLLVYFTNHWDTLTAPQPSSKGKTSLPQIKSLKNFVAKLHKWFESSGLETTLRIESTDCSPLTIVKSFDDRINSRTKKKVESRVSFKVLPNSKENKRSGGFINFLMKLIFYSFLLGCFAFLVVMIDFNVNKTKPLSLELVKYGKSSYSKFYSWMSVNYPDVLKTVESTCGPYATKINSQAALSYDYLRRNIPLMADFVYKDGPVKAYKYLDANVKPPIESYYNKVLAPMAKSVTAKITSVINSFL